MWKFCLAARMALIRNSNNVLFVICFSFSAELNDFAPSNYSNNFEMESISIDVAIVTEKHSMIHIYYNIHVAI